MQRLLLVVGGLLVVAGLAWPWLSKLPFGRLPGDVVIDKPGFRFFAPFTTMIVLSIVVSLLLWLFRK
ncbi:MAG TPA: DUF2905 domain-containing protein [Steroidobacteraceae bacterium]|jgi:hypothetical protein|nr:DUF2905 domain-containing protein [Steroidobacteraceae bacterium]